MRLAKAQDVALVVHVVDQDNDWRAPCGITSEWSVTPSRFIEDLSIGCPKCRTFVVDWLLGRGVSREARHRLYDEIERQPCDCGQVPRHPRSWHGSSGISAR